MTDLSQSAILRLEAFSAARSMASEGKPIEDILADANKVLAFLEPNGPVQDAPAAAYTATPAADPAPQPAARKRGRPAKVTPQERAEATEAEIVEQPEAAEEAEQPEVVEQPPRQEVKTLKAAPGVNRETVAKAMENAVKQGQRDGLKAILGKYGATNLTGIKEAQYGEFLGLIDQMMLNA